MLPRPTINLSDIERLADNGSPMLLRAVGRLFGLGPAERRALGVDGPGGIPRWTWVVVLVGVGFAAGSRVERRWPNKIPSLLAGDRR